ncbi:DUF262 domain-containing protein [Candidatus Poribacteria bacterium]|nr:DUF262 domain-containing protein [Candidatus Poribacteria bacterium]
MARKQETEILDNSDDADEVVPVKYEITSYGADFLVDGLVRRLKDGSIFMPLFQRGFVWTYTQASRFIESLLLGLPVPGIFLSKEYETQKLLVIDGQQRLRTLQYFYEGIFPDSGKEFALSGVQPQFDSLTYKRLKDEDRRQLDNSILHATIVQQEKPPEDDSSIYYIFERLNTSGTPLSEQEIRACIYHGEFNNLLKDLNENEAWRSIYGRVNKRRKEQELILRFFALYFNSDNYKSPMKEFLNRYIASNRHLKLQSAGQLTQVFTNTIRVINDYLGNKAFRPRGALNAAVFDSVMVGVARRLEKGNICNREGFRERYQSLLKDEEYNEWTLSGTTDEARVRQRIQMATNAFRDLE